MSSREWVKKLFYARQALAYFLLSCYWLLNQLYPFGLFDCHFQASLQAS